MNKINNINKCYYLYFSIIIFVLIFLFHYQCQKNLYNNFQDKIMVKPLYDVFHTYLGEIKNKNVHKLLCTQEYGLYNILTVIIILFLFIYLVIKKDITLTTNIILTISILFLIRSITFSYICFNIQNKI